jgi:hypothetical protein
MPQHLGVQNSSAILGQNTIALQSLEGSLVGIREDASSHMVIYLQDIVSPCPSSSYPQYSPRRPAGVLQSSARSLGPFGRKACSLPPLREMHL